MRFNSQFNLFTYVNVCRAEVYGLWYGKMGNSWGDGTVLILVKEN